MFRENEPFLKLYAAIQLPSIEFSMRVTNYLRLKHFREFHRRSLKRPFLSASVSLSIFDLGHRNSIPRLVAFNVFHRLA